MKTLQVIAMTTLTIGLLSCSNDNDPSAEAKARENINLTSEGTIVNEQVRAFSFDLYREVAKAETASNYCLSPLGVTFDMGMVLNGADGETLKQMQNTLGFADCTLEGINEYIKTLRTTLPELDNLSTFIEANSLWTKKGISFKNEYVTTNKTYYNAETNDNRPFDQTTLKEINQWCNDKTKGLIPTFLDDAPDGMEALILNAIYFKGTWGSAFDKGDTDDKPFYLADGSQKNVRMMHQKLEAIAMSDENLTIVELPYGNGAFSMFVFMPSDTKKSVDALLTAINADTWSTWTGAMRNSRVTLSLPRFTMENKRDLTKTLMTLGIKDAFETTANFGKMSASPLKISFVQQRTAIEVTEKGTVAAAATGTGMDVISDVIINSKPVIANFDRPFGFVIAEQSTGCLLFAGKVGNPE